MRTMGATIRRCSRLSPAVRGRCHAVRHSPSAAAVSGRQCRSEKECASPRAPGPCLLTLEVIEGCVEVTVWDSEPRLPVARAADPHRVGQHGLEIVMAVCRSFQMHREPVGKRITATVMLTDDSGGAVIGRQIL